MYKLSLPLSLTTHTHTCHVLTGFFTAQLGGTIRRCGLDISKVVASNLLENGAWRLRKLIGSKVEELVELIFPDHPRLKELMRFDDRKPSLRDIQQLLQAHASGKMGLYRAKVKQLLCTFRPDVELTDEICKWLLSKTTATTTGDSPAADNKLEGATCIVVAQSLASFVSGQADSGGGTTTIVTLDTLLRWIGDPVSVKRVWVLRHHPTPARKGHTTINSTNNGGCG